MSLPMRVCFVLKYIYYYSSSLLNNLVPTLRRPHSFNVLYRLPAKGQKEKKTENCNIK